MLPVREMISKLPSWSSPNETILLMGPCCDCRVLGPVLEVASFTTFNLDGPDSSITEIGKKILSLEALYGSSVNIASGHRDALIGLIAMSVGIDRVYRACGSGSANICFWGGVHSLSEPPAKVGSFALA